MRRLTFSPKLLPAVAVGATLLAVPLLALNVPGAAAAGPSTPLPAPEAEASSAAASDTAILAGGCFWGVQGVFEHVRGVQKVVAGYAGGRKETASYEQVSTGSTGHAESVRIQFDPRVISYGQILRVFFTVALDPTEMNRQGPDSGTQYRSEIFYRDDGQRRIAQSYIAQLDRSHVFRKPIVTRVDPDTGFYAAEGYHQDYLFLHPDSMYIAMNDLPKVAALKHMFPDRYQDSPVLALAERSSN